MSLLTRDYFIGRKRLALTGACCGLGLAALLHFGRVEALAGSIGMALLNFPFLPKTPVDRLLRRVLLGFYLSLVSVYCGKIFLPFAWLGLFGSVTFGAVVICLRYGPPVPKPSQSAI